MHETGAADIKTIEQVVARAERTQRTRDAEGFLGLFHPDALRTTGHGKVLIGLDAIAGFTRTVLPAAEWEGEVTQEVAHPQSPRHDLAAVEVRQVYRSAEGESEGAPLYVMTRQDRGTWLSCACRNAQVHAGGPATACRAAGGGLPWRGSAGRITSRAGPRAAGQLHRRPPEPGGPPRPHRPPGGGLRPGGAALHAGSLEFDGRGLPDRRVHVAFHHLEGRLRQVLVDMGHGVVGNRHVQVTDMCVES